MHSNAIIINNIDKTIERFEPQKYEDDINDKIKYNFEKLGYKYIFINNYNLQDIQIKDGLKYTCLLWSLWFIETRIKFFDRNIYDILNEVMLINSNQLNDCIIAMSHTLMEERIKFYKFFTKHLSLYNDYSVLYEMYQKLDLDFVIDWINKLEKNSFDEFSFNRFIKNEN